MTRVKGGRARSLTNLQLRQRSFDKLKNQQGRTRPGSNSRRKQA